jgi:integrase
MRIPSYRLHKPTNQAVVTIRGRDVYLGKFGTPESKQRYKDEIAKMLDSKADVPIAKKGSRLTVSEAVRLFDSQTNQLNYRDKNHFAKAFEPLLDRWGEEPIASFGTARYDDLRQIYVSLNWNQTHINHQLRRVKRFLAWLVLREVYPAGKLMEIKLVKPLSRYTLVRSPKKVVPVRDEVVTTTLPHCHLNTRGIVQFIWLTGCRPAEACMLHEDSIDYDGTITLRDGTTITVKGIWVYTPPVHKNLHRGITRQILIGPKCQEIIRPYLQLSGRYDYAFPPERCGDRTGRFLTSHGLHNSLKRAIGRAGTEHWTPYQLRHAAGTRFRRAADKDTAGVLLGHTDQSITARYAEEDWEKAAEVVRKVG